MEFNRHRQRLFARAVQYPVEPTSTCSLNDDLLTSPVDPNLVDMDQLHKLCSRGIPDTPGFRPTCWKLLLGYLPSDKRQWLPKLTQQRKAYYEFIKDIVDTGIRFPLNKEAREQLKNRLNSEEAFQQELSLLDQIDMDVKRTLADHSFFQQPVFSSLSSSCTSPRSNSPTLSPTLSSVSSYDLDANVLANVAPWDTVASATQRSLLSKLGDLKLTERSNVPSSLDIKKDTSAFDDDDGLLLSPASVKSHKLPSDALLLSEPSWTLGGSTASETCYPDYGSLCSDSAVDLHWEAMERILYIFAKLNPGVGYVQGMNELLGPIYYVCAHDREDCSLEGRIHAEADAFYLFTAVMGSVRDQYVKQLDRDQRVGVQATLKVLQTKLRQVAPDLAKDLELKGLDPTYYAFRWITVLGTQEFDLPDVIRLWDSLLSHTPIYLGSENGLPALSPGRSTSPLNTMIMVGVSMICLARPLLLSGSFTDNLKLLQSYPPLYDISTIIDLAYHLEALPPGTSLDFQNFINYTHETSHLLNSPEAKLAPNPGKYNVDSPRLNTLRHRLTRSLDATRAFLSNTPAEKPTNSTTWFRAQTSKWFKA